MGKNDNGHPEQEIDTYQFEQILKEELAYFKARKDKLEKCNAHKELDHELKASKQEKTSNECGTEYARDIIKQASKAKLTGLAFSGGGIRSATFNLGVLQALARLKLLDQFDYLSTVSGGGYIGSWYAAWIKRKDQQRIDKTKQSQTIKNNSRNTGSTSGIKEVTSDLAASISARKDRSPRAAMQPDPPPIWHLREYSNYLSPHRGFWSTDTWTLGMTYIRNLLLTLSLLLATLITLVLAIRVVVSLYFRAAHGHYDLAFILVPVLFYLFLTCAALMAGLELFRDPLKQLKTTSVSHFAVISTMLAAAMGAITIWYMVEPQGLFTTYLEKHITGEIWLLFTNYLEMHITDESWLLSMRLSLENFNLAVILIPMAIFALTGFYIGLRIGNSNGNEVSKGRWIEIIVSSLLGVAIFIGLILLLTSWIKHWWPPGLESWDQQRWYVVVAGTPILTLMISIVAVVFVGFASNALNELDREWVGRFFAALSKWTALTTFLVLLVVYSPCLVNSLDVYAIGPAAVWAALSASGAILTRNTILGNSAVQGWLKKTVLAIAPFVFILGMLIFTIWATDSAVQWIVRKYELVGMVKDESPAGYWYLMERIDVWVLLTMFICTSLAMLVWSVRIGVNRFSMHSLYADRLIRAYLGASNIKRNAHPFTGFDAFDNEVKMSELVIDDNCYSGPYLIINAAINMVSSQRLAWQKRKAASFTFTPKFCGYEFCGENSSNDQADKSKKDSVKKNNRSGRIGGYVKSDIYAGESQGVSLGKAMTISGAAASPNMGYHSSPGLTFLMTTFNVRLGWWLPNTVNTSLKWFSWVLPNLKNRLKKSEPQLGLLYLLTELFGMTNSKSDYVYLSDGGHFENLGIYELVRRRCRIIVACDAEADPDMTFSGLGNAIEKCQTDLGVPIDIDVSQIKRCSDTGKSLWHCAVGCIKYSEADWGMPDGTLLYIKSSLTGDEPQNVSTYASDCDSFPHQTTADQWFDETQFESYRSLGEHIVMTTLANAVDYSNTTLDGKKHNLEQVIREARKQWYPGTDIRGIAHEDHDAILESIMDTLRTEVRLAYLDYQLYPNLQKVVDDHFMNQHSGSSPMNYNEFRAGFYFCKRLIQFMQQVYYDRQLDLHYAAPRNRGWMNLFRRWSWSRMLSFTWTLTAGTYGARFQSFCEHRLSLDSGKPHFGGNCLDINAPKTGQADYSAELPYDKEHAETIVGLHYFERSLINEFINAYMEVIRTYIKENEIENSPQEFEFKVIPLLVNTNDPVSEELNKETSLNAGFVITGPKYSKSKNKQPEQTEHSLDKAILYFRIRPSMRNMDLARKALSDRKNHKSLAGLKLCLVNDLPSRHDEHMKAWERSAYRDIHTMEQENIDRCRWFAQLADDEQ